MTRILIALILSVVLALPPALPARILNVPDDFETIQAGINASEIGDTVLVQPGRYVENISFEGRAITVASLILTTSDPAYIDSTIIDGNRRGSVVTINNARDNTILRGFTIRNGLGNYGGGINCLSFNPTLKDLVIVDNEAQTCGGGMHCCSSPSPNMEDIVITSNSSGYYGGGIYFCSGNSTLTRVTIYNNTADERGGGIYDRNGALRLLINCNICNNIARNGGGGIYVETSGSLISNSILWANEPDQIYQRRAVEVGIMWSNIDDLPLNFGPPSVLVLNRHAG